MKTKTSRSMRDIGMIQGYALCITRNLNMGHTNDLIDIIEGAVEDGFKFSEFKEHAAVDYNIWMTYENVAEKIKEIESRE